MWNKILRDLYHSGRGAKKIYKQNKNKIVHEFDDSYFCKKLSIFYPIINTRIRISFIVESATSNKKETNYDATAMQSILGRSFIPISRICVIKYGQRQWLWLNFDRKKDKKKPRRSFRSSIASEVKNNCLPCTEKKTWSEKKKLTEKRCIFQREKKEIQQKELENHFVKFTRKIFKNLKNSRMCHVFWSICWCNGLYNNDS